MSRLLTNRSPRLAATGPALLLLLLLLPLLLLLLPACSGDDGKDEGPRESPDTGIEPDLEPAGCGNGVAEPGESCDGQDFRGKTCGSVLQFATGTLRCNPDCTLNLLDCQVVNPCPPACATLTACLEGCQEAAVSTFARGCANWCVAERSRVAELGAKACAESLPALYQHQEGLAEACGEAICGDNVQEGDETCDDGNTDPGDGCSPDCQRETLEGCPASYTGVNLAVAGSRQGAYTIFHGRTVGTSQTTGSCGGSAGPEVVHRYRIPLAGEYDFKIMPERDEQTLGADTVYLRSSCGSEDDLGCVQLPGESSVVLTVSELATDQWVYVFVDSSRAEPGRYVLSLVRRPGESEPCDATGEPKCAEGLRCWRPEGRCWGPDGPPQPE